MSAATSPPSDRLHSDAHAFYRRAMNVIQCAGVPFLVGGAYAFRHYTGIMRDTKDLDIFVRVSDFPWALQALTAAGFRTETTAPHWLGKAFDGARFVDVIHNAGNGAVPVSDCWFDHAIEGEVLGVRVRLCAPEEMIWSKAFTMERDRYDGADIAHLIRACSEHLDWSRLLRRFDRHWHVLLSHLVLFRFAYPGERSRVPDQILNDLVERLLREATKPSATDMPCLGTLLSGLQYRVDVEQWGYTDGRLPPWGNMTPEHLEQWRNALTQ